MPCDKKEGSHLAVLFYMIADKSGVVKRYADKGLAFTPTPDITSLTVYEAMKLEVEAEVSAVYPGEGRQMCATGFNVMQNRLATPVFSREDLV